MKNTTRRGELAGPVLLIGFGTLILLMNTGRVPVGLWSALLRLWPLALIVLGLDLLIPRRSVLASVLVAALLLGVMFGGAALALPVIAGTTVAGGEEVGVPLSGDIQADITLLPSAGVLRLDSATSTEALLTGVVKLSGGQRLVTSSQTIGDRTMVELKTVGSPTFPVNWVGSGTEQWLIHISPTASVDVTVRLGAGDAVIDGRTLHLGSVESSIGAGRIEVWLPETTTGGTLSAAVGQLVVHVPRGASVLLRPSTVMGGTQVPSGYTKVGSEYRSPGYQSGSHMVIDASVPLGGVLLMEY